MAVFSATFKEIENIMNTNSFTSVKDASYQSCITSEKARDTASYILEIEPSFVDNASKEILAQIKEGQILRYGETHEPKYYVIADGNYVPADAKSKGAIKVDAYYAMSYSSQQFGQFKNDDPAKHGILKTIRDDINKYCSNRTRDLVSSCRKLIAERSGIKKERSATKSFAVFITEMMDTAKTRVKTAQSRGDDTADAKKLGDAIKAFDKVWKA